MELSKEITDGLIYILNANIITYDSFQQILDVVTSYICESFVKIKCVIEAADSKSILTKKIIADIVCLFIEAVRHDLNEENLRTFLHQLCTDKQRVKKLCDTYIHNKTTILSHLESIGHNPPHIVDVSWHLNYCVKLDTCNSLDVPLYHVQFSTKEDETINHVTFSCTIQQLQELVFKLKDAVRYSEKLSNI